VTQLIVRWKTRELLQHQGVEPNDEAMRELTEKIQGLTDQDEVQYADFKPLLQALAGPQKGMLAYRIFRLIKNYQGRYEQRPRYVICLNEERKALEEKIRIRPRG
jgi:hypothetical protein